MFKLSNCLEFLIVVSKVLIYALSFNSLVFAEVLNPSDFYDFEVNNLDVKKNEWHSSPSETFYIDKSVSYEGSSSARLERIASSPRKLSKISRKIRLDFDGQWIELQGMLRTADVKGYASFWLRQDSTSGVVQFVDMANRQVKGTNNWTKYNIRIPLDKSADQLVFGVLLKGQGRVWVDNIRLLVDGKPISEAPKRILTKNILDIDKEFKNGSNVSLKSVTNIQVKHLATIGRIWGFLKYHHPKIAKGDYHWDFELFRFLPNVLNVSSTSDFNDVVVDYIKTIGLPNTCSSCAVLPKDIHILPELKWITDADYLGESLSKQLQYIYENRYSGKEQFYISLAKYIGNPEFSSELSYQSKQVPDVGYRILALFRLWNIIQFWYPYRDQIDDNWYIVLKEFIPRFVDADSWDLYKITLLEFITRIDDGHASIWKAEDVKPPKGECLIPVEIRFIESKAVVANYLNDGAENVTGLKIGDIIYSINGQSIEYYIKEWSPYYSASNESARLRDISLNLTKGECEKIKIEIDRDGKILVNEISRINQTKTRFVPHDRPGNAFQLLSSEVAYLKLSNIDSKDIVSYIEQASNTKGLIIDIRNYPSEFVAYKLSNHFVDNKSPFARITVGDISNPGAFYWQSILHLEPTIPRYTGKVVILVNEHTVSQAEFSAMALQSNSRAIVLGSTTAGADGNVSRIPLPGGIDTRISGIGVYYPDKTSTQRKGIKIDHFVQPSLMGIQEGRDEVLEDAVSHILGKNNNNSIVRETVSIKK